MPLDLFQGQNKVSVGFDFCRGIVQLNSDARLARQCKLYYVQWEYFNIHLIDRRTLRAVPFRGVCGANSHGARALR